MQFAQIPGLETTKSHLQRLVERQTIPHAQAFEGQEGSAAMPLALAFATFANCPNRSANDACGQCPACEKNRKLVHPDVHFLFPTATTKKVKGKEATAFLPLFRELITHNPYATLGDWTNYLETENSQPIIAVNEVRELINRLSIKSHEGGYKVVIIWHPDLMRQAAANALLKVLEEPPPKTLFVLVCEDMERLLPTIVSRTQVLHVPPFQIPELEDFLSQTAPDRPEEERRTIAQMAEGSMRRAQDLLSQEPSAFFELFAHWMRACYAVDFQKVMDAMEAFGQLARENQKNFMEYSLGVFRESLISQYGQASLLRVADQEKAFVEKFSPFIAGPQKLALFLELFNQAHYHLERNGNPKIIFMDLSGQIMRSLKG